MAKKLISLMLALSMVLSLGAFSAFAEDAEATVDEAVQAVADVFTLLLAIPILIITNKKIKRAIIEQQNSV